VAKDAGGRTPGRSRKGDAPGAGASDLPLGALALECSACREETPVTAVELARLAFPFSLALPMLKRENWAYLRCPACGHRTWMQPHIRL